jgi:hypothetical protein
LSVLYIDLVGGIMAKGLDLSAIELGQISGRLTSKIINLVFSVSPLRMQHTIKAGYPLVRIMYTS